MSISPTKLLVLSSITRANKDEKPTDCILDYKSQPITLKQGDRISLFCYSIFNQSYNVTADKNTLVVSEHYHLLTSSNKTFTIIEKVGGEWLKTKLSMPEGEVITTPEDSSSCPRALFDTVDSFRLKLKGTGFSPSILFVALMMGLRLTSS